MPAPATPLQSLSPLISFLAINITVKAKTLQLVDADLDTLNLDVADFTRVLQRLNSVGLRTEIPFEVIFEFSPEKIEDELMRLRAAVENTPLPYQDLTALLKIFDLSELGVLLEVETPELKKVLEKATVSLSKDAQMRAHFLAMIVADLSGSYTNFGIKKWFSRKRSKLQDRSPFELLERNWKPDDERVLQIRKLAESLVGMGAT